MSLSALNDELAQVRTKKKEFLAQIERIVPWGEWVAMIKPCYYKGERGNKPYDLELMLRLYLLQNLYNLSDEATVRIYTTLFREWSISLTLWIRSVTLETLRTASLPSKSLLNASRSSSLPSWVQIMEMVLL